MNTLNTLSSLIGDHVKANDLENTILTNSGSLRTFVKNLVAAVCEGSLVDKENNGVFKTLVEFSQIVNNQEAYGDVLSAFQRLSDAFCYRIKSSYEELSKIKDTVNKLTSEAALIAKARINEDPVLASTESDNTASTRLEPIRWDLLNDVSQPVLFNRILNRFDIKEDASNQDYTNRLIISKLPFENEKTEVELKPVELTKKNVKDIINALSQKIGNRLSKDAIKACLAHVMTLDPYKCKKAVYAIKRLASGESANTINDMIDMVKAYNTILPYLTRDTLGTAASTQANIDSRASVMRDYIDVTAYLCNNYRNVLWKDAIVVPGMKINTDNWQEFCSADKKAIKANPMLAIIQYKNKIYGEDAIPAYGISSETIINACDNISKEAAAEAAANISECNAKKKEIFRDSFITTAGKWLRSQKKYSNEYLYSDEPERFAASIFDSNRDDAVENMFYTVILNSCHIDTLTAKLHNKLRNEYKRVTLSAESINERDIINADTKVLADTINEFMVDLLLV